MYRVLILLLISTFLSSKEMNASPEVYSEIVDIYHPTIEDLRKVQRYISYENSPIIGRLGDKAYIPREFKLIGNSSEEIPEEGVVTVNTTEADKDNCIIIYASFNQWYPQGVSRLINIISRSKFKGHVRYRIGGWPNIQGGDLILAHVPFAFKVCFFREVQNMGYKRVLWLDSAVVPAPHLNLNAVFFWIQKYGYFVQNNWHSVGAYMNAEAAQALNTTLEKTYHIKSCSAAVLGIDFDQKKGRDVIAAWYNAAKDPEAFYSPRSDQNALSIILHQHGINKFWPHTTLKEDLSACDKRTLFVLDRSYVKYKD